MDRKRILIVEDEAIVQVHLEKILRDLDYDVCGIASTADEALDCAASNRPDLVLMDIRLKGDRDGIEAAHALRKQHGVAVVFLTAYADEETVKRTEAVGAVGYLLKPFSPAQVRAMLSTALAEYDRYARVEATQRSLEAALGSVGEGVVVIDETGAVTFMNAHSAALTGHSVHKGVGLPVGDVLRGQMDDGASLSGVIDALLKRSGRERLSGVELSADGGVTRTVDVEIEPLEGTDGALGGLVIVLRGKSVSLPEKKRPRRTTARTFGPGTKMLIYSHDTFGLGHLRRCLNLSQALLSRYPGLSILLVTGSAVVHQFKLPRGLDYVKLPAVRKVANERYEPRTLSMTDAGILKLRTNLLLRTIRDYEPNVLLVDHAPIGMKGELKPALDWLQHRNAPCIKIAGLRDIVDDPDAVVRSWTERGIYDVLRDVYDHIVVYGTQSLFDLVSAYRFPRALSDKTTFLNYVTEQRADEAVAETRGAGSSRPLVVVTIGGGDGGEALVGAYLNMLDRFESDVDFDTIMLPGPFLSAELLGTLKREAKRLAVTFHEFVPSTSPYLERADLVVSTGGYNTMTQTLFRAKRALVVPRVLHRKEQLMRAERLRDLGLVSMLHPQEATPERLYEAVTSSLNGEREPLTEARANGLMRFDGTTTLADFCGGLAVPCLEPLEAANE